MITLLIILESIEFNGWKFSLKTWYTYPELFLAGISPVSPYKTWININLSLTLNTKYTEKALQVDFQLPTEWKTVHYKHPYFLESGFCQCDVSAKATWCWGPAKQTSWFGVSNIKQESQNPNFCSQAISILPAMHGKSGWIRGYLL